MEKGWVVGPRVSTKPSKRGRKTLVMRRRKYFRHELPFHPLSVTGTQTEPYGITLTIQASPLGRDGTGWLQLRPGYGSEPIMMMKATGAKESSPVRDGDRVARQFTAGSGNRDKNCVPAGRLTITRNVKAMVRGTTSLNKTLEARENNPRHASSRVFPSRVTMPPVACYWNPNRTWRYYPDDSSVPPGRDGSGWLQPRQ